VDVIYKEDPQELFLLRIRSLSRFIEVQQQLQQRELELERQHGQKMSSIGALASGVAHEFNNLLQPILGFSEMMLGRTDPDSRDYERLTLVRQSAVRGAELVRQILDFSRKDAKRPHQPIALFPLLKNILKMVQATLPDHVRLVQQIDPGVEGVRLGATELHQVILNLCNNSVQAIGGEVGEIVVSVVAELEQCRIVVRDTGHGMDETVKTLVFDPFFTTREVGQGSGMGLPVVMGIIQRAGGKIELDSAVGKGSLVTIHLPMEPLKAGAEVVSIAPLHGSREQRILLVDDAPAVVAVGLEMLEEAGYQVETALSGSEALQRFSANPHDLVVTDLSMPGMSGMELGAQIQALGHQTPMVLLTGVEVDADSRQLKQSGIETVLRKPIAQSQLGEVIAKLL
jgi:nitrogen-specific signal transduction histidine kinase/CheY-like chemotaxis protein